MTKSIPTKWWPASIYPPETPEQELSAGHRVMAIQMNMQAAQFHYWTCSRSGIGRAECLRLRDLFWQHASKTFTATSDDGRPVPCQDLAKFIVGKVEPLSRRPRPADEGGSAGNRAACVVPAPTE